VGVDASAAMLARARAKAPAVEFRVGDLTKLPLETGSMDLAVCALALTHFPDLGPPVRELARVVRPGAHVVLSDQHPVMSLLGGSAFFVAEDGSFAHVTSYFHSHGAYVAAFNAAGLRIRQCLEPCWTEDDVTVVLQYGGLGGLADDALRAALIGVPGALVWDLQR
jgi:SAM-dependent methyltransferase